MICVFYPPDFTFISPSERVGNALDPTPSNSRQLHKNPEKQGIFRNAMDSADNVHEFTIAADFEVNGRNVLLPLMSPDLAGFACTNRVARLARGEGGFIASCTGPLARVQIMLTAMSDPLLASRSLLREREQLMRLAEAAPSSGSIRCRSIETYVSDLTRDTPVLAVHLLLEGHEAAVSDAISPALLTALEAITGGSAHVQPSVRCTSQRLVQADVRLATTTLSCGRHDGRSIAEGIVQLHQLNSAAHGRANQHNTEILRGIAPAVAAMGNDWRMLEAGAQAWAARNGGDTALAHWELDAQDYLCGTLVMPVPTPLADGASPATSSADARHRASACTDVDEQHESAEVLAAIALAQSLTTLRAQAIEQLQRHSASSPTTVTDMADHARVVETFTDAGADVVSE